MLTSGSTKRRPHVSYGSFTTKSSVPVRINVRCYSNSDIIVRRSEVTLRASSELMRCNKFANATGRRWFEIGCQACSSSSNALASFRSSVSKPSVNQP